MNLPDPVLSSLLVIIAGGIGFILKQLHVIKDLIHALDKRLTVVETIEHAIEHKIEDELPHKRRRYLQCLLPICFLPLAFGLTACGSLRTPLVTRPVVSPVTLTVPATTNTAALVTTNTAPDGAAVIVTNQVVTITPPQTVTRTVTNYVTEVNPALASALDTARQVNSAINPTPAAPFINAALLGVSGVLGWFARLKTVKAARAAEDAAKADGLLNTIIAGVEAAKNDDVKKTISEISRVLGTRAALDQKVQLLTHA